MNRRDFIQLSGAYIIGGGMILLPTTSHAFWPWVARFLFGRVAPRAIRGTSSKIVRSATLNTARKTNFKSVVNMGVIGSSIISVSPKLYADINKYNAQAIWVNEEVENNFYLSLSNNSKVTKSANLSYQIQDIDTGKVEIEHPCGYLSAAPMDEFKFSFSISELPYLGAKRLIAVSSSPDLYSQPSGNIMVTTKSEVIFNEEI
jgi:hypothetical protein